VKPAASRLPTALGALVLLASTFAPLAAAAPPSDVPSPMREFRAAWIATVSNIDWPSRPGLPVAKQKEELVGLLDAALDLNLNAVVLQIRPAADAFYASKIEPWSPYLTGEMGRPPAPFYDPLEYAVDEAHARGLQLHVWFNPYRVRHADAKGEATPDHASVADRDIVRTYGQYLWFDPGEPAAVQRFLDVLTDVVKRYDIDGVHIDDYFYPYQIQEAGKTVEFPDDESYARAVDHGETLERNDWRRQNVNRLVEGMYQAVKREKPWVLVGISPFGIWRPGYPKGITGLDQYDSLYADARKWFREGWVDYYTPQLYWRIEGPQSYPKLLAWWQQQNRKGRHLWPGNGAHNVRRDASAEPARSVWEAEELINQIELTRKIVKTGPGNIHFSMKCLVDNRDGLTEKLQNGVYAEQAIVPESPWLGDETPKAPKVTATVNRRGLTIEPRLASGKPPWQWVVRVRSGDAWKTNVVAGAERKIWQQTDPASLPEEVAVSAVTRLGREGPITRERVGGRD
jgi:uncharacterized lipoprotein YddW (UPF0748 family)